MEMEEEKDVLVLLSVAMHHFAQAIEHLNRANARIKETSDLISRITAGEEDDRHP